MGQYNVAPDVVSLLYGLRDRVSALERQTQHSTIPLVRVTLSTSAKTVINNAAQSPIAFDSEQIDTNNIWSASDPTRFVANAPGVYLFVGGARFTSNATAGYNGMNIVHSSAGNAFDEAFLRDAGTDDVRLHTAGIYKMSVGDYVTLEVFQSSGGNKVVSSARFAMAYLGPAS